MTQQNEIIKAALKNNRPVMLLGKAGTAKTATVNKIANDLGLPVETLPLAGISPEDIGGLPRPNDINNPTAFKYLAPEWFQKHMGKPFVLFLDEFNQATIDTMHAMFYLVNDRMTAGIKNPEMRIVAAGNTEDENEFLTPIPVPLRDRFVYQIKWKCELENSLMYLEKKYPQDKIQRLIKTIRASSPGGITPRHVEHAIFMVLDDVFDLERGRELIGPAYEIFINDYKVDKRKDEDSRLEYLKSVKEKMGKKYIIKNGKVETLNNNELKTGLTDEELEIINDR